MNYISIGQFLKTNLIPSAFTLIEMDRCGVGIQSVLNTSLGDGLL